MTNCWFCGSQMIWQCDFSFEDYCMEGEGIVATLLCSNCEATAEFYTAPFEEEVTYCEDCGRKKKTFAVCDDDGPTGEKVTVCTCEKGAKS